jgi:hypothetical protein
VGFFALGPLSFGAPNSIGVPQHDLFLFVGQHVPEIFCKTEELITMIINQNNWLYVLSTFGVDLLMYSENNKKLFFISAHSR